MRDLYLLIKPRLLALRNQLARAEARKRKRAVILSALALIFCGCTFFLSSRVLIHFHRVEVIGDILAHHLLSMVLLMFFSLLIFSHIITALSNLYLSRDLELCHSTPVVLEELFLSRATYTFIDSSWMLIVFGLPIFMAYAYVYRPGLVFYVTLLHMNLALAVIAGGFGILVTMLLVYVFPARRTRDLVLLLSMLMLVTLYIMFRFLRPEKLVNPEAFFTLSHYLSALKVPQSPYLPTHWIAETLWEDIAGTSGNDRMLYIMLTWTSAAVLIVVNVWVAQATYFQGFSKSQEAKKRRVGGRGILDLLIKYVTRPFGEDVAGVIAKDIRTFFRDNTQWSQLVILGALVLVYVYNFSVLPLDKSPIQLGFLQNQLAFINMGLAGFVLSAVSARFVFPAVSGEGEAYWIVRSSPLRLRKYLWGKYLFFLIPMLLLAEVLIVVTNHMLEITPFMMFLSSISMFFMVFGIVALGIGLGALYPNFRHQNIAQVSTGFGGVMYMIISSLFIGIVILLEAGPVYIIFMSELQGNAISTIQWLFITVCFLLAAALNLVALFKPMKMGLKALEAYE